MNILYGVTGEGLGHATRSEVMIRHLAKKNDLMVLASQKAYDYLSERFDFVQEIDGFSFVIEDNALQKKSTVRKILTNSPGSIKRNTRKIYELIKKEHGFDPHAVVTDFDSLSHTYSRVAHIPCISVDNIQMVNRCEHRNIPKRYRNSFRFAREVVRIKCAYANRFLITSFFFPPIKKSAREDTRLYMPILRDEVVRVRPTVEDHILVYQTSNDFRALIGRLREIPGHRFIVYGYNTDRKMGNVTLKKRDDRQFLEDLASSRGVLASAGFSLMSEAVSLHKPYMALPIEGQFEQVMNCIYLKRLGYGEFYLTEELFRSPRLFQSAVESFTSRVERYQDKLRDFPMCDSSKIKRDLEEDIHRLAMGKELHLDEMQL